MKMVQFDTVIHAPNRLQICAFLAPLEEAEFKALRQALEVSDSVLSKHIKQLEDAGYVKQRKSTVDGRQRTWASLTDPGRAAFAQHVAALRSLVDSAKLNGGDTTG
ncbi:MAG: transcriptional regulator [Candidatus Latescibacteria bacterium]|jgi:DNA-binding MarR family transcriptional regulator|nr:transcriptional regulator [Candidatus Latescibacterota bacterium]